MATASSSHGTLAWRFVGCCIRAARSGAASSAPTSAYLCENSWNANDLCLSNCLPMSRVVTTSMHTDAISNGDQWRLRIR